MKNIVDDLKAFHFACDIPIIEKPMFPLDNRIDLRVKLQNEEHQEFLDAVTERNLVKVADALADMIYIAVGTALEFGIPLEKVWDEVQRSNMAKIDPHTGKVNRREDGKILKPVGWKEPDIKSILMKEFQ